jgi:surface antigen
MLRIEARPFGILILTALTLGGCNSAATPPQASTPAPPPPPAAGVVGTAIGQSLDDADREKAVAAQNEAVNSGTRKTWRGAHGAYGFIVPGPEAGSCRDYAHKIFINGRPQEAKGQACRGSDGAWRVTG